MEENSPNFFMGYLLEGPSSPSFQGLNVSSPQGLGLSSSCEFEFSFSTFGFGVGLECKC
jgi:hypothetical protein